MYDNIHVHVDMFSVCQCSG